MSLIRRAGLEGPDYFAPGPSNQQIELKLADLEKQRLAKLKTAQEAELSRAEEEYQAVSAKKEEYEPGSFSAYLGEYQTWKAEATQNVDTITSAIKNTDIFKAQVNLVYSKPSEREKETQSQSRVLTPGQTGKLREWNFTAEQSRTFTFTPGPRSSVPSSQQGIIYQPEIAKPGTEERSYMREPFFVDAPGMESYAKMVTSGLPHPVYTGKPGPIETISESLFAPVGAGLSRFGAEAGAKMRSAKVSGDTGVAMLMWPAVSAAGLVSGGYEIATLPLRPRKWLETIAGLGQLMNAPIETVSEMARVATINPAFSLGYLGGTIAGGYFGSMAINYAVTKLRGPITTQTVTSARYPAWKYKYEIPSKPGSYKFDLVLERDVLPIEEDFTSFSLDSHAVTRAGEGSWRESGFGGLGKVTGYRRTGGDLMPVYDLEPRGELMPVYRYRLLDTTFTAYQPKLSLPRIVSDVITRTKPRTVVNPVSGALVSPFLSLRSTTRTETASITRIKQFVKPDLRIDTVTKSLTRGLTKLKTAQVSVQLQRTTQLQRQTQIQKTVQLQHVRTVQMSKVTEALRIRTPTPGKIRVPPPPTFRRPIITLKPITRGKKRRAVLGSLDLGVYQFRWDKILNPGELFKKLGRWKR